MDCDQITLSLCGGVQFEELRNLNHIVSTKEASDGEHSKTVSEDARKEMMF